MRFGFVTCVQLGLSCLEELISIGHIPEVLITLEDGLGRTKSGRVYIDELAKQECIPLIKIRDVNDSMVVDAVQDHDLDWLFIIGWSQIARAELLGAPRRGVVGIHPTLLPVGRGRASVPWAILKDLDVTGVTMFKLDEGVDTGPIIAQLRLPLSCEETATTLYARINEAHRALIREGVTKLDDPQFIPAPQNESSATVWPGRRPSDGEITASMTATEALRLVRATTRPYPGAFTNVGAEGVLRIWNAGPGASETYPTINLADRAIHATDFEWECTD